MSTIAQPRSPAGASADDRTPRRLVLLSVSLVALTAVAASLAFLVNTNPLRWRDGTYSIDRSRELTIASFDATSPSGEDFQQVRIRHEGGAVLQLSFTITNTGSLPVRVMRIGPTSGNGDLDVVGVAIGPDPYLGGSELEGPFSPFRLGPGEQRYVEVRTRITGCMQRQDSTTLNAIPMGFSILGIPRTEMFVLPYTIELVGQDASCF